jgi:hypothetical protein
VRILLIAIAVVLVAASPALAQDTLEHAADTLKLDPVYVDSDAQRAISDDEADDLRAQISDDSAGPLYIAILPASVLDDAGGSPERALRDLAGNVDEPGVYATVIGNSFRAGATSGVLPTGEAGRLAREAFDAKRDDGTAAVLSDFVSRVGKARGDAGSETGVGASGGAGGGSDDDGGGKGWLVIAAIAVAAALFGLLRRRRRRREEEAQFAQARGVARDDVIALGEEIRALDLDMDMPDVDAEAKRHYGVAVDHYQLAEQALEGARQPEDLRSVSERLEEGRFEMEAARALLEARPVPERRPPCFFDPRHGPSVEDVEWAPPGGEPRSVPACAADAVRVKDGEDPAVRHVAVNGREVPYWQAGPAYGPFAGGFFAGGLVPGLFLGSLLAGDGGLFGGDEGAASDAGDFGDMGGGDFGGGDFGGGDFGGGGDF